MLKNSLFTKYVLLALNILFFVYYFILMLYNGFAADDYGFLASVKNTDAFAWVSGVYANFSGRFVRYFFYYWKYRLFNVWNFAPIFYPLIAYFIYVGSICFVFSKIKQIKIDKVLLTLLSFLFVNIAISVSFERTAFFWLAAIDFYSSAILYPIWLFYFCYVCKNKWASYIGIVVFSIIIGGSNEAFSPLMMFVLFAILSYDVWRQRKLKISDVNKKLIVAFVFITLATVIVFMSPGNSNRISWYVEQPSLFSMLLISFKSVAVFLYLLLFKLPYFALIMLVCACVGILSPKVVDFDKKIFVYSFLCMLFLIWICTFPAAYGMGEFGFQRIYTPTISWVLMFCCIWSFVLGQNLQGEKSDKLFLCANVALMLACVAQIANICIDTKTVKFYREREVARNNFILLEKAKGRTETLYLDKLPSLKSFDCKSVVMGFVSNNPKRPILYYGNGLWHTFQKGSDDSFTNECLMGYWDLPFVICQKTE